MTYLGAKLAGFGLEARGFLLKPLWEQQPLLSTCTFITTVIQYWTGSISGSPLTRASNSKAGNNSSGKQSKIVATDRV